MAVGITLAIFSAVNGMIGTVNMLYPEPNLWAVGFNFAAMVVCGVMAVVTLRSK